MAGRLRVSIWMTHFCGFFWRFALGRGWPRAVELGERGTVHLPRAALSGCSLPRQFRFFPSRPRSLDSRSVLGQPRSHGPVLREPWGVLRRCAHLRSGRSRDHGGHFARSGWTQASHRSRTQRGRLCHSDRSARGTTSRRFLRLLPHEDERSGRGYDHRCDGSLWSADDAGGEVMEQLPPLPRETAFRDDTRVRAAGQGGIWKTWWQPYRFRNQHRYMLTRETDGRIEYADHDALIRSG